MRDLLLAGGTTGFVGKSGKRCGFSRALAPGWLACGYRVATGGGVIWPQLIEYSVGGDAILSPIDYSTLKLRLSSGWLCLRSLAVSIPKMHTPRSKLRGACIHMGL
jgi:hypothetical protein